jgi:RND family efflux transporter MFP subunit
MGRVDQILRREGDRVRAGEPLARIESREVSARLAQAEANVAAASAMETNARLMKERMERLLAKQAATRKNVEDATAGYDAAAANLAAAKEGVAAARMYVAYSEVTAPFAGVVVERRVEVGDTAAPGTPLFVVDDTSKMKIEAQVPESALRGVAAGDPVEVEVDSAGGGARSGTVSEVLPAADPRSRSFTVRAVLDNADGALRPGMFARLRLGGEDRKAVVVPESAVVRRGPLTGVFTVDGQGIARLRWVSLGEARDGRVEVLSGLSAGERIVTEPPAALEDGRRVEVL